MNDSLLTAAGLGAVTGLRSLQGLAWTSRELAGRRTRRRATRLERWLADDTVATILAGLAVGELVADKLPGVPARITPGPLLARAVIGALVGSVAAGRRDAAVGAAVGAAAAAAGAFTGWFLRTEIRRVTTLPDPAVAVVEDAAAVLGARRFAHLI